MTIPREILVKESYEKMGLSSSQARLLHLTSRMHQIEYKAAKLEAEKLQMANESSRVYEDYLLALDKTKIQGKVLTNDGSITYVDVTYQSMLDKGYQIKFQGDDRVVISQATKDNYDKANGNVNYFVALQTGRIDANNKAKDGVYEIYTADQLMSIGTGKNYRLMADIDMTGKNWTSKSLGNNTFDGNGYSITGLNNALFSTINGGTVKNLSVSGNVSSASIFANTINSNSTLSDIAVSGNISSLNPGNDDIGGFAGAVQGSNINISNCSSNVNLSILNDTPVNTYDVGSFIGFVSGSSGKNSINITNCSSSGNIESYGGSTGGFIGHTKSATVTNCSTSASITANNHMGGFIGFIENTEVSNCNASGTINIVRTANNDAGTKALICGGFTTAEDKLASNISNSSFTGRITGDTSGNVVSAFVDRNGGNVNNCYTSVPITTDTPFIRHDAGTTTGNASAPTHSPSATGPSLKHLTTLEDPNVDAGLFAAIQKYGYILEGSADNPAAGHENDTTWFTNMVLEGMLFIYKPDATQDDGFIQVSVATDTNLQEVQDNIFLKKAEAQYEADMKKIDRKDRQYDTELARLENERNAISKEMETLQTVAKENVDRTFKLFS